MCRITACKQRVALEIKSENVSRTKGSGSECHDMNIPMRGETIPAIEENRGIQHDEVRLRHDSIVFELLNNNFLHSKSEGSNSKQKLLTRYVLPIIIVFQ
jgi:hypothetical protein